MNIFPAIDLRDSHVVQLVGGNLDDEAVREADPLSVAERWVREGFGGLHIIDLDAAFSRGDHQAVIESILARFDLDVQVGGGIRSEDQCRIFFDLGAKRVIVGTRALEDERWLSRLCDSFPNRIIVAADERDSEVVTHAWRNKSGRTVTDWITQLNSLPLASLLITDVGREGRLCGVDSEKYARWVKESKHPVQASGGIRSMGDLKALESAGVAGAVLGMSLYQGHIGPEELRRAFPAASPKSCEPLRTEEGKSP